MKHNEKRLRQNKLGTTLMILALGLCGLAINASSETKACIDSSAVSQCPPLPLPRPLPYPQPPLPPLKPLDLRATDSQQSVSAAPMLATGLLADNASPPQSTTTVRTPPQVHTPTAVAAVRG